MAFTKVTLWREFTKGDPIRISDEEGVFLFDAHVTNRRGDEWIDCFGPCTWEKKDGGDQGYWRNNGQARSFDPERVHPLNAKLTMRGKERKVPKNKDPQNCVCGCGGLTKGGRFIPGHDARLKGRIVTQWREATTQAGKDKARKALTAVNPDWEKYLVEAKPKPVKATKAAKAPAKAAKTSKVTPISEGKKSSGSTRKARKPKAEAVVSADA